MTPSVVPNADRLRNNSAAIQVVAGIAITASKNIKHSVLIKEGAKNEYLRGQLSY
jgi:hypothetical protein